MGQREQCGGRTDTATQKSPCYFTERFQMPRVITAVGKSGFDSVYLNFLDIQTVQFWEGDLGLQNTFLPRGEAWTGTWTLHTLSSDNTHSAIVGVSCARTWTWWSLWVPPNSGYSMILWSPSPPWRNLIPRPSVRLAAHVTSQKTPALMEKDKQVTLKLHPQTPQHQWNILSYPEVSALKALHENKSEIRASQAFSCR